MNQEIIIYCSANRKAEREYSYSYVFSERLGLNISIEYNSSVKDHVSVKLPNGSTVNIADIFFHTANKDWLQPQSLPETPLNRIDLVGTALDGIIRESAFIEIYGLRFQEIISTNNINVDIFGSVFFLLSGYEEYVVKTLNEFGNFPYKDSLADKENYLKRPLVEEYVEIFWSILKKECPDLKRKHEEFLFLPTHDIDRPYLYYNLGLLEHIKASLGDLLKRKSIAQFIERNMSFWGVGRKDPYNTYEWLMDLSDELGLTNIFYFKNSMADSSTDAPYRIDTRGLNGVFKKIDARNHIIGFHPSYNTHTNNELMNQEIFDFRNHLTKIGVKQSVHCVRQHYLRYEVPTTSIFHEQLGFDNDSTLGHWNKTGFRRGTCHEFYIFDVLNSKKLAVKETPLIVMEATLSIESDLPEERWAIASKLIEVCKYYKGKFVLLWHNELLFNDEQREFYKKMLLLSK